MRFRAPAILAPLLSTNSEQQLEAKLDHALGASNYLVTDGRCDFPRDIILRVPARASGTDGTSGERVLIRQVKIGVVQDVKNLGPELQRKIAPRSLEAGWSSSGLKGKNRFGPLNGPAAHNSRKSTSREIRSSPVTTSSSAVIPRAMQRRTKFVFRASTGQRTVGNGEAWFARLARPRGRIMVGRGAGRAGDRLYAPSPNAGASRDAHSPSPEIALSTTKPPTKVSCEADLIG